MGAAYSIADVIEPRIDRRIVESADRERLVETVGDWSIEDIREVFREYQKQKPEQTDDFVKWPFLFRILETCQFKRETRLVNEARQSFHPSCHDYAMFKDDQIQLYLNSLSSGSKDNSNTSSSSLDDEEKKEDETEDEKEDEKEDGTKEENEKAEKGSNKSDVDQKSSNESKNESMTNNSETGEEKDGKKESDVSVGNEQQKDEEEEEQKDGNGGGSEKIKRSLNPSIVSPIFFGYTYMTQKDEDVLRVEKWELDMKELEVEDTEGSTLENNEQKIKETHNRRMERNQKLRSEESRKLLKTRADRAEERKRELKAAKKAMSPQEYEHFARDMEKEDIEYDQKCKEDDEERKERIRQEDMKENLKFQADLLENGQRLADFIEKRDTPKGEKLVEQSSSYLKELQSILSSKKSELRVRNAELTEAKRAAGDKADKPPHRGLIVVAEGEVKKAETAVAEATVAVEDQQVVCRKAQALRDREARFLPVYNALVRDDPILGLDCFTVDMLASVLLLCICCHSSAQQKLNFSFELYSGDPVKWLLENEDGKELMLDRQSITDLLLKATRTIESLGGCVEKEKCSSDYISNLVERMFLLTKSKDIITKYEFRVWGEQTIRVSRDLAKLFQLDWKYAYMSRLHLNHLSYIKQYELGLLTLDELNARIARLWVSYRVELSNERKLIMHERALAMGADDPLKPDYSKYLKKKKRRMQSNAIPLEHDNYGNIVFYNTQLMYQTAVRLQSQWRANRGRATALREVKRRAFYSAWEDALADTRATIEDSYKERELSSGVARMKWDAKIRMRQVKLRAKGRKLSREEVIKLMVEEEVAVKHDEVNKDFSLMEEERGFLKMKQLEELKTDKAEEEQTETQIDTLELPPVIKALPEPEKTYWQRMRAERKHKNEIRRETRVEYLVKTGLEKAGYDINDPKSYRIDSKVTGESDGEDNDNNSESSDRDEEGKNEDKKIGNNNVESVYQILDAELPPVSLPGPTLDYETRKTMIRSGVDLDAIYSVGTNIYEKRLIQTLRNPDPEFEELYSRLRLIGETMTQKKVNEMLLELPSKRLLIKLIKRFDGVPISKLEDELVEHFGLLRREIHTIAASLRAISYQDLLCKFRIQAEDLVDKNQLQVKTIVDERMKEISKQIDSRAKIAASKAKSALERAKRKAKEKQGDESTNDNQEEEEEEKEKTPEELALEDLKQREEKVNKLRNAVEKAILELEKAQEEMDRAKHFRQGELDRAQSEHIERANERSNKKKNPEDDETQVDDSEEEGLDINKGNSFAADWREMQNGLGLKSLGEGTLGNGLYKAGKWYANLKPPQNSYIGDEHRINWAERSRLVMTMSESDSTEIERKYSEMYNLYSDFIRTASQFAKTLILERYLPPEKKTLRPFRSRDTDIGRCDKRWYWKACNIHFKFAADDDGICNGSEEFAQKYYGHSIRNSVAYAKCHIERLYFPLEAVIDFHGVRIHARSHMPIAVTTFDSNGNKKRVDQELIHGTQDRGMKMNNSDKNLDRRLRTAAKCLNLAEHGVKGERDLLAKYLHAAADLQGFQYTEGPGGFSLINFRRAFPPESPEEAHHLSLATRGHSIFWRVLRPEFVKTYKVPLSPDAISLFTRDTKDWEIHTANVVEATQELIKVCVPAFAEELASLPVSDVTNLDITAEMHRRGINMRHLGLLRSRFWFRVQGTIKVTFKEKKIVGSHDITRELERGRQVKIESKLYRISTDDSDVFDSKTHSVTLDDAPLFSANDSILYCGEVISSKNSPEVRSMMMTEILARTLKNMIRTLLREIGQVMVSPCEMSVVHSVVHYLNLLSGSSDKSDEFWASEIIENVTFRFGAQSLSELEKLNLHNYVMNEGILFNLVGRFLELISVDLTHDCLNRFKAESHGEKLIKNSGNKFVFTPVDIANTHCRVKHNMYLRDFAQGIVLSCRAKRAQAKTYESVIMENHPTGYWPLTQRTGAKVATNYGSAGLKLSGNFQNCILGVKGKVLNQWPDRALRFPQYEDELESYEIEKHDALMKDDEEPPDEREIQKQERLNRRKQAEESETKIIEKLIKMKRIRPAARAKVDTQYDPTVVFQSRLQPFTVECWIKVLSGRGKEATILMSGRYAFQRTKEYGICFIIFDAEKAVKIKLESGDNIVEENIWYHVVGTFDGTIARLFIDALIVDEKDVDKEACYLTREKAVLRVNKERKRREEEKAERESAIETMKEQALAHFKTKGGQIELSSAIKRQISISESRLRLNKEKAKILGLKPIDKVEARVLAIKDYVDRRTKEYHIKITERHRKIIQENEEMHQRRLTEAKEHASTPLRIGAASSNVKASSGWSFFHGEIQHVAVYASTLTRDEISERFLVANRSQETEAQGLYAQAVVCFKQSLLYCHDDPRVQKRYAESICSRNAVNSDRFSDIPSYLEELKQNLRMFIRMKNVDVIAEMLYALPDMNVYSDVVVESWLAIKKMDPIYFAGGNAEQRVRRLENLERMPDRFELSRPTVEGVQAKRQIWCAAEMYKFVLTHSPDFYGSRVGYVGWISKLDTPELICYFINKIKNALERSDRRRKRDLQLKLESISQQLKNIQENLENSENSKDRAKEEEDEECRTVLLDLDLTKCTMMLSRELAWIGENDRIMEIIDLTNCSSITAEHFSHFFEKCKFLLEITLDGCVLVDDAVLRVISEHCMAVHKLSIEGCRLITDKGLLAVSSACTSLRTFNIGKCEQVSDACLEPIFTKLRNLEHFSLTWCIQISNPGIYTFAKKMGERNSARKLLSLDLSACRRISDDGIIGVAKNLPSLTKLNLCYCNKISNKGVRLLIHNLWKLVDLNLGDLYQVIDTCFYFDQDGDGREIADTHMMSNIEILNLTDCNRVTDHAISEIARRAKNLRRLSCIGCSRLTDEAVRALTQCPITKQLRGENLVSLDFTFCIELTGNALHLLGERCRRLQEIKLSGCSKLTDEMLGKLCMSCSGLQSIALAHCKLLTDKTLQYMAEYLWVEDLDISYCSKMTDVSLSLIAENFTGMLSLNLCWCHKMTEEGLQHVYESCQWLHELNVSKCENISQKYMLKFQEKRPNCTIIR